LGYKYYSGKGVVKNYVEAVKWFCKAAEQGNADAQNNLGVCYALGHGVEQSQIEAVKWYRKAAEQGNADAQNYLGSRYQYGRGIERNEAEAAKWFREALVKGNIQAQSKLAWLLATSKDEKIRDGKEAVDCARKACEATQWNNANHLDTLAAAYAEAGDFDQAAGYAQKAMQAADPTKEVELASNIVKRWKLYENKQPYRE